MHMPNEFSQTQKILIIDDDINLTNTFKLILQIEGFNVDTASTGLQGLHKVNKTDFDLVIVDMSLPDMMGDEIAETIKKINGNIKIIILTGYNAFQEGIEDKDINELLMKPIEPEDLIKTINKILEK